MPSSRLALAILLALPAVIPRAARADTRLEMMRALMFIDTPGEPKGFVGGSAPASDPETGHTSPAPASTSAPAAKVVRANPVAVTPAARTTATVHQAPTHPRAPARHNTPTAHHKATHAPAKAVTPTPQRAVPAHRTASSPDAALIARLRKELAERDAQIAALREELRASRAVATVQLVPVDKHPERAPVKADPTAEALAASRLNREALQAVSAGEYRVAVAKFRRAADLNDPAAMANLGTMYLNGTGVPQDAHQALDLLVRAANKGNRTAAENLGTLCEYGISGVSKNPVRAYQWYEVAARLGSTTVQTSMARIRAQD